MTAVRIVDRGAPGLVAALREAAEVADVVLIVDAPGPSDPALVERLVAALADADAAATFAPLTDAVKRIGSDGRVEAVVDRSSLGLIGDPCALRGAVLARIVGDLDDDAPVVDPVATVLAGGGRVAAVEPGSGSTP